MPESTPLVSRSYDTIHNKDRGHTVRLNKTLTFAINFAHQVSRIQCAPVELAQLIARYDKVFHAGERDCNEGTEQSAITLEMSQMELERFAHTLGFTVSYPGLSPLLNFNGQDFYLPDKY